MKRFLFALIFLLLPSAAMAQCNGVFAAHTGCGNPNAFPAVPQQMPQSAFTGIPGGTPNQVQYNNAGAFGGFTFAGDCTVSIPNITCTKTNGVGFAASATTDTTVASNITSGNLSVNRLNGGTGANANTFWSGTGIWSSPVAGTYNALLNGLVADLQFLSDGACHSNTTFNSATANFSAGDVGKAISIAGCGAASATLVTTIAAFVNSTTVTLTAPASATVSGELFGWGTDNTTALNNLITSLTAGGTIYFPTGNYGFTGKINVTKSSITFLGQGPSASTSLYYIGTSSTNFFDLQSVANDLFQSLTLRSLTVDWTGWIMTIRNSGGGDPSNNQLSRVIVSPSTLSKGLLLDTAIETEVKDTNFSGGTIGIGGRQTVGSYSNVFRMEGGQFLNQSNTAISLGGNSWVFNNVTFENSSAGKLVAFTGDTTVPTAGLSFIGCWFGDATVNNTSPAITVWGQGFVFTGNVIAGNGTSGGTAISLNNVKGFSITGNLIEFWTTAIDYTTATVQGGLLSGNSYHSVTNFEGTTGNKDASVINTGNISF